MFSLKKKRKRRSYDLFLMQDTARDNSNNIATEADDKIPTFSFPSRGTKPDINDNIYDQVTSKHGSVTCLNDIVDDGGYSQIQGHNQGHEEKFDSSDFMYSKVKKCSEMPVGPVNFAPEGSHGTTSDYFPLHVYATVDTSRKNSSKYTESEDGEGAPRIPEKSSELQQDLDTQIRKTEGQEMDVANNTSSVPSLTRTITTPSENITSVCHSKNPLFEFEFTDNMYAETDTPTATTSNSPLQENIYESIYSESLRPFHFMQDPKRKESIEILCPYPSIYTIPTIAASQQKALEISKENIQAEGTLGYGHFGKVLLAKTVGLSLYDMKIGQSTDKTIAVPVSLKMLKSNASESSMKQFVNEYCFMYRLNHPNVIRLLGICLTETPFIMMEYMDKGDLNKVLKQYHGIVDRNDNPKTGDITQQMLIQICTQIASGMNYLASNNFIHRDLATRNCLVGENFVVKIADFGMRHKLYESHYFIIHGHATLPVRWMATECFNGKFSAKTDVWSFGVTMWEIFMLAEYEPYYKMSDADLVKNALSGSDRLILSCPKSCPNDIYEIMKSCWAHNASERLTFEQLHQKLLSLW